MKFDINSTHGLRLLQRTDRSAVNNNSYAFELAKTNPEHIKRITNEADDRNVYDNLVYLRVTGKNQLIKEINEISKLDVKDIDKLALHRNEITYETEPI